MDENVLAAMARWPNVPEVYGWLSLNAAGHWRLHPDGGAMAGGDGEAIGNLQVNRFINRNYTHDTRGRWFFQNGPQRVYVCLEAAPYIVHVLEEDGRQPVLITHTGVRVDGVRFWCMDDQGRLYAQTDAGAGLVAGRDTQRVAERLNTPLGQSLLDVLEGIGPGEQHRIALLWNGAAEQSLCFCVHDAVPAMLGFVRCPAASA